MEEKLNMCLWHVHLHYITKNIKIPFWYKIIYYLNNSGTTIECPKYIPNATTDYRHDTFTKMTSDGFVLPTSVKSIDLPTYNNYYTYNKICINYTI